MWGPGYWDLLLFSSDLSQLLTNGCARNGQPHNPRDTSNPKHIVNVTSSSLASFLASSNFFFLLSGIRSSSQLSSRFEKQKSMTFRTKTRAKTFPKKKKMQWGQRQCYTPLQTSHWEAPPTIMGKTMAARDTLMTQSRTRQVSWIRVKRWTFRRGTCRR